MYKKEMIIKEGVLSGCVVSVWNLESGNRVIKENLQGRSYYHIILKNQNDIKLGLGHFHSCKAAMVFDSLFHHEGTT